MAERGICDGGTSCVADEFQLILKTNYPWFAARATKLAADETKRLGGSRDDLGIDGSFRKLAVD